MVHEIACPACGQPISRSVAACPHCGAGDHKHDVVRSLLKEEELEEEHRTELATCRGCGRALSPYVNKCPGCGLHTHLHHHVDGKSREQVILQWIAVALTVCVFSLAMWAVWYFGARDVQEPFVIEDPPLEAPP